MPDDLVENPKDLTSRLGTDAYRAYKERLKALEPQVFVDRHLSLPDAPRDLDEVAQHPELAAFTYMRNQCQRCHHAVKGRQTRGDFRGMGCSSCHIPYGAEGLYEGDDPSIPHDKPGAAKPSGLVNKHMIVLRVPHYQYRAATESKYSFDGAAQQNLL